MIREPVTTCTLRRVDHVPDDVTAAIEQEPIDGTQVYLDTAWYALDFLFTIDADAYALLGFLSEPERAISADDVEAIDEELGFITEDQLRARWNPARLREANIPPPIWDRPPAEDDALGWVLGYFAQLQALVHEAAKERQALLVWFV